ncbi:MAG: REP-associated tyrosine transposase [Pseudomonadota bacterium]|nr:REP-associated tyrosine transposase [Pseudomonadota bacterium]
MPNHIHGIIEIVGAPLVGARSGAGIESRATTRVAPTGQKTIGDIVGAFKSLTTHAYIHGVKNNNWISFNGKLWQRNYYEHIIRNEESYLKISEYILTNSVQWLDDTYYV